MIFNELDTKQPSIGSPIVDKNRIFSIWNKVELYHGPEHAGKYVPNVNDLVVDYDRDIFLKVTNVNYSNYEYQTVVWAPVHESNSDAEVGGAGITTVDSFRIYIDTSKFPATLRVDSRLSFKGSDNDHIKIFRGTDTSVTGEIISAYVRNGVVVSDSLPLELVATEGNNIAVKAPVPGACKGKIVNNELVTIVVYGDQDNVTSIARCYVVLTNMVIATEAAARSILSVKLKSPFISPSNEDLLELPINIPLDDIPLYYEVTYTDGVVENVVDGTKATFKGLRNSGTHDNFYISSISGQELDCVLTYKVGKNETYIGDDLYGGVICRDYKATTLPVDGAYSVKLFVVPQWLDTARGYRLNYYLYNLERGNLFDATAYVTLGVNTPPFDPTLYGIKQHLVVVCNLNTVSPIYNSHQHVQSFGITLLEQGTSANTPYLIEYLQGKEAYGDGLNAKFNYDNVKYWRIDLSCGIGDKAQWIHKLYRNIYPLFDRRTEADAPLPTHFEVVIGNQRYVRTINDWMTSFNIEHQVQNGQHLVIHWIHRTPNDELRLGSTPLLLKQVN